MLTLFKVRNTVVVIHAPSLKVGLSHYVKVVVVAAELRCNYTKSRGNADNHASSGNAFHRPTGGGQRGAEPQPPGTWHRRSPQASDLAAQPQTEGSAAV